MIQYYNFRKLSTVVNKSKGLPPRTSNGCRLFHFSSTTTLTAVVMTMRRCDNRHRAPIAAPLRRTQGTLWRTNRSLDSATRGLGIYIVEAHYPTEINHSKANTLVRITWDDGHVGEYPETYLRGYCPCALCQGHGAARRFVSLPDAKLVAIQAVGNYAIEFRWQDGHSTGIYTYEYLRSLCPCPSCSGQ
jgi:DUF971 family protein